MKTPAVPAPIRQGDVFFIEFDRPKSTDDHVQGFPRPCIVVSRTEVNATGPTVVVVPMSKHVEKANSYRIKIPKGYITASSGEKFIDSVALCDHIRVVNKKDLKRWMGALSNTAVFAVTAGLGFLFDC